MATPVNAGGSPAYYEETPEKEDPDSPPITQPQNEAHETKQSFPAPGFVTIEASQLEALLQQTQLPLAVRIEVSATSISNYTFPESGATYVGEMQNGLPHGKGTTTFPITHEFITHTGGYVAGKREGYGTVLYRNGQKYQGGFKEGRFHGVGRLDGAVQGVFQNGKWENGAFVEGTDRWVTRHGQFWSYTGTYRNGKEWTGENTLGRKWKNGKEQGDCAIS